MDTQLSILNIAEGTSVDGPGLRTAIYFAGCSHHCLGCHNPESWDIDHGTQHSIDEVIEVIRYNEFPVTFTGGDPFYQVNVVRELARTIKQTFNYDIWCYTGFLWEELIRHKPYIELLRLIDVLVDGRFILEQRDISLLFRGSSNQRIINVQSSFNEGVPYPTPVLLDEYKVCSINL